MSANPPTPNSVTATNWPLITLVLIAAITGAMYIGKAPPALPAIREELNIGLVAAGWVVSIVALLGTLGGISAGLIADRIGHGRLIKIGLVAFIAGGTLGAATDSIEFLVISRIIEGSAYILVAVASPSLISGAAAPSDRNLAVGLYGMCVPIGMSIAILASPPILAAFGWRGLWLAIVGLSVLMLILTAIFVRPAPRPLGQSTHSFLRNTIDTMRRPGPNILMGCFFAYTAQWTAVMVWLPTFIVEQRAASLTLATMLTALVIIMNIGGNWMGSVLLHKGVPRWLLISIGTTVMGLTGLGFFPDFFPDWIRYGLCLLFSLCGGMQPASLTAGAPVHAPSPAQLGTTNGYWMQGSQFGQLIGTPAVAAVVTISGGWAAVGPALALGTVLNLALAQWLRRLEK